MAVFCLFFVVWLALPLRTYASVTDGSVINAGTTTAGWASEAGWVRAVTSGDVRVSDAGLTGSLWNGRFGWLHLSSSTATTTSNVRVTINATTGALGGNAWSPSGGWVDFTGVFINPDTGIFYGTTTLYTSVENNFGMIYFSCPSCTALQTDWRGVNSSARATSPPASGGGGGGGSGGVSAPAKTKTSAERADIQGDGVVDVLDFNSLMVAWGKKGSNIPADTNQDGIVDVLDFNSIMVFWKK